MHINQKRLRTLGMGIGAIVVYGALSACGGGDTTAASQPPATPPPPNTVGALSSNSMVVSTVAPNGDQNPYFIATPPASFTGVNATTGAKTVLQPGDLLISDFSVASGANTGTSIMRYSPSTGDISLFYQEHIGAGPVAGAVSGAGTLWIANFQLGYKNPADGATTGDGNVVVISANGTDFPNDAGIIDNSSGATFSPTGNSFAGPWGQVLAQKAGTTTAFFFNTNTDAGTGYIQREEFTPGQFSTENLITIGTASTGTNAFDPTGPQGMAYDATNDILYVVSTASDEILAFLDATTTMTVSPGMVVFQGTPLNAPVGLTINPINGDLIAVNQLDNNVVEIAPNLTGNSGTAAAGKGSIVGVKLLDPTPVNATAGTGSALFGVLATKDAQGNLNVYYTDSVTNSLNVLK